MKETIRPNIKGVFAKVSDGLHTVALGNGTQFEIGVMKVGAGILFSIVGKGCYAFDRAGHDWGYVGSKFDFKGCDGDARNFADFVSSQFTHEFKAQGEYCVGLCSDDFSDYTLTMSSKPADYGYEGDHELRSGTRFYAAFHAVRSTIALSFPGITIVDSEASVPTYGPKPDVIRQIDRVHLAALTAILEFDI